MRISASVILVIVALEGCSEQPRNRAIVFGQIKLDGQPIETGSINFMPTAGTAGPTAGGSIAQGSYRIDLAKGVVIGKNRVELRANRKTGRKVPNPFNSRELMDEIVEAFPPQYNRASTLVREIATGENSLDFDLSSKPK